MFHLRPGEGRGLPYPAHRYQLIDQAFTDTPDGVLVSRDLTNRDILAKLEPRLKYVTLRWYDREAKCEVYAKCHWSTVFRVADAHPGCSVQSVHVTPRDEPWRVVEHSLTNQGYRSPRDGRLVAVGGSPTYLARRYADEEV